MGRVFPGHELRRSDWIRPGAVVRRPAGSGGSNDHGAAHGLFVLSLAVLRAYRPLTRPQSNASGGARGGGAGVRPPRHAGRALEWAASSELGRTRPRPGYLRECWVQLYRRPNRASEYLTPRPARGNDRTGWAHRRRQVHAGESIAGLL